MKDHNIIFLLCGVLFLLMVVCVWESMEQARDDARFERMIQQEYKQAIASGESEYSAKAYIASLRAERNSIKAKRSADAAQINSAISAGIAAGSSR